ncbi:MAG: FtsQ-type POTRA domain-containing protein [Erysipelotrichaceae bacterium]|nr:FtsQ-type POTRA domain-containing protein [Erysipelotrichaceae bacterium]
MKEESFYDRHNKYLLAKRRNLIIRIVSIILLWTMLVLYFVLPVSKIDKVSIEGNVFLTKDNILSLASLDRNGLRIDVNNKDVEKRLNNSDYIKNASSKINLFSSKISIKEIHPIGLNDGRILWSDGTYSNKPLDEEKYGYLPTIKTTINASFVQDFENATSSWGRLRKEKNMLLIDDNEYPLTDKNTYSLYFEEIIEGETITIIFVVDRLSVTKKITLDLYQKVIEDAIRVPSNVVDGTLIVGYVENSYSYWRL